MQNLVFTQLSIPEVRQLIREELEAFFNEHPLTLDDGVGKGAEYASKITGKAVPTVYDLVHKNKIPHYKQGKDLYFKKSELLDWMLTRKQS